MAIDAPAKLAILGAGPIGLEAALYARFLGYDVVVYERGDVAASVRQWGHVCMFTPFGMNRTTLGLASIQAQDESYRPPGHDKLLTGHELAEQYLLTLANTDLVSDQVRVNTTVVAIGKQELLKGDLAGHEDRGDWSFRVLSRDAAGAERIELFDAAIDCTGVFATANYLGHGGIPAVGEPALRDQIEYRLPDILGRDRDRYSGKHTLVIGAGHSAATNVVGLAELAGSDKSTRITWITRREGAAAAGGPVRLIENDQLRHRDALARQANFLATRGALTYRPFTVVERLARSAAGTSFTVELSGEHAGTIDVDEIIANVGFRPDNRLYEELQISERDAERLPTTLRQPEPNFYILGAKSYGRQCDFLLANGYQQIREVFTIIGDRESLDLYSSATRLLR